MPEAAVLQMLHSMRHFQTHNINHNIELQSNHECVCDVSEPAHFRQPGDLLVADPLCSRASPSDLALISSN